MVRSHVSRHYLPLALGMALLLVGTACDQVPYGPPSVEPDPEPEDVVKQDVSEPPVSTLNAEESWTEARMEAAQPADLPQSKSKAGKNSSVPLGPARPNPDREPVRQSGRLPEHTNGDVEDVEGLDLSSKRDDSVKEASQVSNPTQYPYSAVGKIFFVNNDGEDRVCSGAVIYTKNKSTVWTAGHCVSEQGEEDWYEEWIFVPAYNDGNEPFGVWEAVEKGTLRGWHVDGSRNYDIAAVKVERKDGEPIADVTGSFGHVSNISRDQDWQIMGYPVGGDLFGEDGQMWQCSASDTEPSETESNIGPATIRVDDCDMTGGASGSPWITDFDDCPDCWVNSAHSWGFWKEGHPNRRMAMEGPYHGEGAVNLYEAFDGWKP